MPAVPGVAGGGLGMDRKVEKAATNILQAPNEITLCTLDVVVVPNGEVICNGRIIGWVHELGKYLRKWETNK